MSEPIESQYDVVVVGAGPTGLTLAIDLGQRGVRTLLLEKNDAPTPWPKLDRCNPRTMESYRRLGIADRIRALGFPPDNPMDVFIVTRLADAPLAVLRYPSVGAYRRLIDDCQDGTLPLEPYQLVSQNRIEPLLRDVAQATPNVSVSYDAEVTGFSQDDDGISLKMTTGGGEVDVGAAYLVGCDGGRSTLRRQLGIHLEGVSGSVDRRQVIFRSDDLYEKIPMGKGRHYVFADHLEGSLVVQGDRKEFTFHTSLPEGSDFEAAVRQHIGFPCEVEILHVLTWRHQSLIAERYRDRRVFLAGDAVHLVIPTGGLGMNTGVGDAFNLSWKLAGVVSGWGGERLLESYEQERRPVAVRNREASMWAAEGVRTWRALVEPGVPPGENVARAAKELHARMHGMLGAELGYSYAGSAVVAGADDGPVTWDISTYEPSGRPGSRVPHVWLDDGRALQDVCGGDYTLLDVVGEADLLPVERAFSARGVPLSTVRVPAPRVRALLRSDLLLLRPDLHIAWAGDELPAEPTTLVELASGLVAATP